MAKICIVNAVTRRFGHEDLVKTKLFILVHIKSMGKAFYPFENFKISQLDKKLSSFNFNKNHKIIPHKIGNIFVKKTSNFDFVYTF
jgi:hypothetical protein